MKSERWWISTLFLRLFIATASMSDSAACSQQFQYRTALHISKNDRASEYPIHGSAKNIFTSERQLRGADDRSTSGKQIHLSRHKLSNQKEPTSKFSLLQLMTDITNGHQKLEETSPVFVKHQRATIRVKYADNDGKLLSTSNHNDGPCSLPVDAPPKPHNTRPRPGFNPTGW